MTNLLQLIVVFTPPPLAWWGWHVLSPLFPLFLSPPPSSLSLPPSLLSLPLSCVSHSFLFLEITRGCRCRTSPLWRRPWVHRLSVRESPRFVYRQSIIKIGRNLQLSCIFNAKMHLILEYRHIPRASADITVISFWSFCPLTTPLMGMGRVS